MLSSANNIAHLFKCSSYILYYRQVLLTRLCVVAALVLEQDSQREFVANLKTTFKNFAVGIKKLPYLYKQQNLKPILKTSLVILITAESVCILTAESVDLIFYNYSIMLSIPLALLAGAFTVVAPEAYKKTVTTRKCR